MLVPTTLPKPGTKRTPSSHPSGIAGPSSCRPIPDHFGIARLTTAHTCLGRNRGFFPVRVRAAPPSQKVQVQKRIMRNCICCLRAWDAGVSSAIVWPISSWPGAWRSVARGAARASPRTTRSRRPSTRSCRAYATPRQCAPRGRCTSTTFGRSTSSFGSSRSPMQGTRPLTEAAVQPATSTSTTTSTRAFSP